MRVMSSTISTSRWAALTGRMSANVRAAVATLYRHALAIPNPNCDKIRLGVKPVGATGEGTSVERCKNDHMLTIMLNDLICRTAGYVARTSNGGRSREASPQPDWAS